MELPNTTLGLLIAVVGPFGFGNVISFMLGNFKWFADLDSGKKVLLISFIGVVFCTIYYLATQVISPDFFAQVDKYYITFVPYLAQILGEWVFHSQVTVRKETAAAVKALETPKGTVG